MDNFSEFTDLVRMHELSGFEPYSKHYVANPYPTLARLRAEQPIFFDEDWRLSFFTRYEDVKSIMKNRQQFGRDFRNRLSVDEVDAGLVERLFPSDAPMWVKFVRESFIDFEPP